MRHVVSTGLNPLAPTPLRNDDRRLNKCHRPWVVRVMSRCLRPPDRLLLAPIVVVALLAVGSTACSLLPPMSCPGALLEGRLAPHGSDGALLITEFGPQSVRWPDGYGVETSPELVLRDQFGSVVARDGDPIYVGGGEDPSGERDWAACGRVGTEPPN